jgi:hypothetical protein
MFGAVLAVLASGVASASPAFGAAATEASERAAERAFEQAPEQECLPAWRGPETAFLPARWQQALDALIEATAHEGQPWSCPDARVTLVPPGPPQTPGRRGLPLLQVEDAAGVRRHPVTSPGEIVPLGEAMLARTFTLETPAPRPPPSPPVSLAPVLAAESAPWATARGPRPPDPSVLVDFLVGSRVTGPTLAVLMGAELRTTLVFDRWSAGLMARYDSAVAYLQPVPDQFSLSSVSIGLTGGFRLLAAPIELTLAVEPSLGVLLLSDQRPDMTEPEVDTKIDMRLGTRLSAAIPLTERIRALCALGGEGAPEALFSDRHSRRRDLPLLPAYMAGLSLGLELVAIR